MANSLTDPYLFKKKNLHWSGKENKITANIKIPKTYNKTSL